MRCLHSIFVVNSKMLLMSKQDTENCIRKYVLHASFPILQAFLLLPSEKGNASLR